VKARNKKDFLTFGIALYSPEEVITDPNSVFPRPVKPERVFFVSETIKDRPLRFADVIGSVTAFPGPAVHHETDRA